MVLLLCLLVPSAGAGLVHARMELQSMQGSSSKQRAPLYLPEIRKVRLITLGFDRFLADVLWFNTLNYFGKQLAAGADYRWLGHMCELVTNLNAKNRQVVEFCATMLSWVAQRPRTSTKILRSAINEDPQYWRYQYLLGFNYWYFHEDKARAKSILQQTARLPNAPAFVASLAASITVDEDNPAIALRFLQELAQKTTDENARKALNEKIQLAEVSRDIKILEQLIRSYEQSLNREVTDFQQLLDSGQLREIPRDPFGEPYVLQGEPRRVISKQGREGLKFRGRTASTGLARFEKRFE